MLTSNQFDKLVQQFVAKGFSQEEAEKAVKSVVFSGIYENSDSFMSEQELDVSPYIDLNTSSLIDEMKRIVAGSEYDIDILCDNTKRILDITEMEFKAQVDEYDMLAVQRSVFKSRIISTVIDNNYLSEEASKAQHAASAFLF